MGDDMNIDPNDRWWETEEEIKDDKVIDIEPHREAKKPEVVRPEIKYSEGLLHETATKAEDYLLAGGTQFYARGDILVRPVIDDVPSYEGRVTKAARLRELTADTVIDHMSRRINFKRYNARKKDWTPIDPPRTVAATLLSRDGEWKFPKIAGVITSPTIRRDGSILYKPGYDPATRLLLVSPPPLPAMPREPTKDDAMRSLLLLDNLLTGFPFVDQASRSVVLSGMITPVVRGAMSVSPMHVVRAPTAGSGKSFVVDLCAAILTGKPAPVIAAGRTEEETEKRLGAELLTGQPIIAIDNLNGQLAGDALCQMIERPFVKIRILGLSKNIEIESRATIFATGNNIQVVSDMTRRVVLCSLDPNMERPELRTFKTDPMRLIMSDRGKYIAACLTIVRAYILAGKPKKLAPLASFNDWSDMVRSALVWLGRADPLDTMEAARADDTTLMKFKALCGTWLSTIGPDKPLICSKVIEYTTQIANEEFASAMRDVASASNGNLDAARLGKYLSTYDGRIVDGIKLTHEVDSHTKTKKWLLSVQPDKPQLPEDTDELPF